MKNYIMLLALLSAACPAYSGKNQRAAELQRMAAYHAWLKANAGKDMHDVNCPRSGRGCPQCNITEWRDQGASDKSK